MKTIKRRIKRTTYRLNDFTNVKIPSFQRWTNEANVKSLQEAVLENGQLRDVLICITKEGTKILTDGRHLYEAMKGLCLSSISVMEVKVKDEDEARDTFISFNTKGKTLNNMDYVVSFAGGRRNDYRKFLQVVMQSPKTMIEANSVHSKLFTIPSLINIFLGGNKVVKSGEAKLPKNFDRISEIVEYLGENYLSDGRIVNHCDKNGKSMKLNGGSIIPVMNKIKANNYILSMKDIDILKMLIDFTYYHYTSTEACTFSKDSVAATFSTFLQLKNL